MKKRERPSLNCSKVRIWFTGSFSEIMKVPFRSVGTLHNNESAGETRELRTLLSLLYEVTLARAAYIDSTAGPSRKFHSRSDPFTYLWLKIRNPSMTRTDILLHFLRPAICSSTSSTMLSMSSAIISKMKESLCHVNNRNTLEITSNHCQSSNAVQ